MKQRISSLTQGGPRTHERGLATLYTVSLFAILAMILVLVASIDNLVIAQRAHTYFTPTVNITIPQVDADGDGVNDWAGTRFDVMFSTRTASPTQCTPVETIPYRVFPDGSLKRITSGRVLVDVPNDRSNRCLYAVSWPSSDGLALQAATSEMSADTQTATAVYELSDDRTTTFTPVVNISVPHRDENGDSVNDYAGTKFEVEFRLIVTGLSSRVQQILMTKFRSHFNPACPRRFLRSYVVQDSGEVSGSAPVLVDSPAGLDVNCRYGIIVEPEYPSFLLRSTGGSGPVDATSMIYWVTYADVMSIPKEHTPNVRFSIPQIDVDGNGVNDYAGTTFVVIFYDRRNQPGCTSLASGTYVVQNNGIVSGSTPSLVHRRPGMTREQLRTPSNRYCRPFASYPQVPGLALKSGHGLNYVYEATDAIKFPAEVEITVPQVDADGDGVNDFVGSKFMVQFRPVPGSDMGCTPWAVGLYTVQDSGIATGVDQYLVRSPAGATANCVYNVEWPDVSGLVRRSGTTTSVSVLDGPVTASYRLTAATSFAPNVDITVPQFDADGGGVNDFSGRRFTVTFKPAPGSAAGCSASVSEIYVVQDNGTVTGLDPKLVDLPVDATANCSYDIVWPALSGLVLQTGATAEVRASAKSASANYEATTTTFFSPNVAITVPQVDADVDGANDFSGTNFLVTFRRVFGSDVGCTSSTSGTYIVQDSGAVSGSSPSLVDSLADATTGCTYAVSWPTLTDLVRQFGATATVSSSAKTVSATYQTGPTYVAPEPAVEEPEVEAPVVEEPVVEKPEEAVVAEPGDGEAGGLEAEGTETQAPDGSQAGGGGVAGGADAGSGSGVGANVGSDSGDDVSGSVPVASAPEVGVIQLPQGWVMLPFNGPSGMAPADFAQALEGAINSVWVWDMSAQQWKGWTANRGPIGLTSLLPGDVVMVYAPTGGVVVYSPADLLGHRVGVNSWTLAPTGISLVVYGGGTATSASDVFASYANSAVVVYLWDSQNQRWEYHLPGRQPLDAVQVPWFSDINPGDAMFVYNISPTAVTIPWQ